MTGKGCYDSHPIIALSGLQASTRGLYSFRNRAHPFWASTGFTPIGRSNESKFRHDTQLWIYQLFEAGEVKDVCDAIATARVR